MDADVYRDMALEEQYHWWFKGRREIIKGFISTLDLNQEASILEVGCGTGGNLPMLSAFGQVHGLEPEQYAVDFACDNTSFDVRQGSLPESIGFDDQVSEQQFDLICLFDVLEHIEDDKAALIALKARLKDKGRLILTVPAYQWLFGKHDRLLHHFRRYNRTTLNQVLEQSGYSTARLSFFNSLLLPLVIVARMFDFLSSSKKSAGYSAPTGWINRFLYRIFKVEQPLLKKLNLPVGCSIIVICQKQS